MDATQPAADPFQDPFAGRPPDGVAPGRLDRGGPVAQRDLGIWVLILGDMMIFALFFGVFMYERGRNEDAFGAGRETLELGVGALNTVLLLTGSLFVVLAVSALRRRRPGLAKGLLAGAALCGFGFIADKVHEYAALIDAGHTPASNGFFTFFFVLTGIHLVHLVLALGVLAIVWRIAGSAEPEGRRLSTVEAGACFWHLVDLLWIVLFALLFLVR